LAARYPDPGETFWRGTESWPKAWDEVARLFNGKKLPVDVRQARQLEELVANLRRRVELAFIDGKSAKALDARRIIERVAHEAELALGIPKSPKKRRRHALMRFLDECSRAGLSTWPDFDALSRAWVRGGEEADPDDGYVSSKGWLDEDGWWLRVDLALLRGSLAEVGDISSIPPHLRDTLVASWAKKGPGAKAADGTRGPKIGAYAALQRALKIVGDSTGASQLKKEWSEASPRRPRKGTR
jgi:hypothetical protein